MPAKGSKSGQHKDLLHSLGILADPKVEDGSKGPIPPPAPPAVTSTYAGVPGATTAQVDSAMLEHMRSDIDRAGNTAFMAFRDKLRSLAAVPGMTNVNGEPTSQCIAAAIATCGYPKDQILAGVQNRSAELERLSQKFNDDVAQARSTQLKGKDDALKQLDDQIAARQRQSEDQIKMLQTQIDQVKAAADTDVQGMNTRKTTLQTERATMEQQLTASVQTFTATAAQLRSEIAAQTTQFSVALSS